MYKKWKDWTASLPRTDIWRAGFGIVIVFTLLFLIFGLQGCANVNTGPSMGIGVSHRADAFVTVSQDVWKSSECNPRHSLSIEYLHHSEIFKEGDEDVYDGGIVWFNTQFGNPWKK